MIGCLDRSHRLCKVLAHLDMLIEYMIPCHVLHLDETALGIASLGDDMALSDPSRLGSHPDEELFAGPAKDVQRSLPR